MLEIGQPDHQPRRLRRSSKRAIEAAERPIEPVPLDQACQPEQLVTVIEDLIDTYVPEKTYAEQWDTEGLRKAAVEQLNMELPVAAIQIKELEVTGVFRYANCYPAAIGLAASGAVDLDGLVTGKFGLEQVEEALTASRTNPQSLKPVVYPGTPRF